MTIQSHLPNVALAFYAMYVHDCLNHKKEDINLQGTYPRMEREEMKSRLEIAYKDFEPEYSVLSVFGGEIYREDVKAASLISIH